MKTINRDLYLNQIIDRKENGLIKVITGIRRCGKSYLLFNLYYDYLVRSGVKEDHIVKVALDDDDNKETMTALKDIFSNTSRYQEYVIYYTGEYDNLTFHCVKAEDFKEDEIVDLFKAEENSTQFVCYNHYKIKVPMTTDGRVAARISSANID